MSPPQPPPPPPQRLLFSLHLPLPLPPNEKRIPYSFSDVTRNSTSSHPMPKQKSPTRRSLRTQLAPPSLSPDPSLPPPPARRFSLPPPVMKRGSFTLSAPTTFWITTVREKTAEAPYWTSFAGMPSRRRRLPRPPRRPPHLLRRPPPSRLPSLLSRRVIQPPRPRAAPSAMVTAR